MALPFVLLARRRTSSDGTSPAEIVTYLILAVATLITTNSVSSLLEIVMPGDGVLIAGADDLALSLSTLIVAGVVAVALWIAMERTTTDQARPARELYLAVVNAVSMTVFAIGAVRVLLWAVGVADFEPSALADLAAFGATWFIHERLRRAPEELDELRQLAGALLGLALSSGGAFGILFSSFDAVVGSGQVIVGDDGFLEQLRFGFGPAGGRGSLLLVVLAPGPVRSTRELAKRIRRPRFDWSLAHGLHCLGGRLQSARSVDRWARESGRYVDVGQRRHRPRGGRRLLAPPTGAWTGAKPADPHRRVFLVRGRANRRVRGGCDSRGRSR